MKIQHLIVLALLRKGGSFGYFYTLHQIFMRCGWDLDLSKIIGQLIKLNLIDFRSEEGGKRWYYLLNSGVELVPKLTLSRLDELEKEERISLSFVKSLLF